MCGPIVVGICSHYLSGIRGDRGLFCQKHGHVPVSMDVALEPLEDWEFHRDSYPSEDDWRKAARHRDDMQSTDAGQILDF